KPRLSQLLYLPQHKDCLETADYNRKLELIAERYLDHDVRAIAGTTCWFSLLFDKLLGVAARRGRRTATVTEIWPNLRVLLGRALRGRAARAPRRSGDPARRHVQRDRGRRLCDDRSLGRARPLDDPRPGRLLRVRPRGGARGRLAPPPRAVGGRGREGLRH